MGADDYTTAGEERGDVTNGTVGDGSAGGRAHPQDEEDSERTLRLFDTDGERAARRDEAVRAAVEQGLLGPGTPVVALLDVTGIRASAGRCGGRSTR